MSQSQKIPCFHCGEDCGAAPVMFDGKPFCCNGCKSVYQILNQHRMQQYYTMMDTPGLKPVVEQRPLSRKYAWLDNEDVLQKLIEFRQDSVFRTTLYIPTIHCSSCIWLLENLDRLDAGINRSVVNFVKKEVTVTWDNQKTTLRQIVQTLAEIHYEPEITLEDVEKSRSKKVNRRIIYQIGVAGFAFSNIMLLSLPDYLAHREGLELTFRNFFGWINLLLALPVVVFSAWDYYASAFGNLRKGILNLDVPIVIGLITLFLQSLYEIITGSSPGYFDSLAGFVFFLLIGRWYQGRTYQALSFERNYRSYFPVAVTRLREGREESLMLKDLQKGDSLLIHNLELIPADGRLVEGEAFINYAFVTGESLPVRKLPGDVVYAGGRQVGGAIVVRVEEEVEQSRLTKLWNQGTEGHAEQPITRLVDKVSRHFTAGLLGVAALTLAGWLFYDPSRALMAFVSVLIVACPCALALTLPFAWGTTMQVFGRRGLYLRDSSVVENLAGVDAIVFDKTGTLTIADERLVTWEGDSLSVADKQRIKSLCRNSVHPLSQAVVAFLAEETLVAVTGFRELSGRGLLAVVGDVEVRAGSSQWLEAPGSNGQRTDATEVHVAIGGIYRGCFIIGNRYRLGLAQMIPWLKAIGSIHVISGDNDAEKPVLVQMLGDGALFGFNMTPNDKLGYIRNLKKAGYKPLMIGDGLNDAGALLEAHAGISVADDVYHFSPGSDAILEAGAFDRLAGFLRFSRRTLTVVRISFLISIVYNIIGLTFAVRGVLSPVIAAILMPASSVTVVLFVTGLIHLMARRSEFK